MKSLFAPVDSGGDTVNAPSVQTRRSERLCPRRELSTPSQIGGQQAASQALLPLAAPRRLE